HFHAALAQLLAHGRVGGVGIRLRGRRREAVRDGGPLAAQPPPDPGPRAGPGPSHRNRHVLAVRRGRDGLVGVGATGLEAATVYSQKKWNPLKSLAKLPP